MTKPRLRTLVILILALVSSLAFSTVKAQAIRLCWDQGGGQPEILELHLTAVSTGIFSVAGKVLNASDPLSLVTGTIAVDGGQAIAHLSLTGTEPGSNGLFYAGQVRAEIDLGTRFGVFESMGLNYDRNTTNINPEHETGTLTPVTCPAAVDPGTSGGTIPWPGGSAR